MAKRSKNSQRLGHGSWFLPDTFDRSISAESLRQRIALIREAGERLDKLNYLNRNWLAGYAGDVDVVSDCLEELLDQGIERVTPFATQFQRIRSA
jgi:hypothetical protein